MFLSKNISYISILSYTIKSHCEQNVTNKKAELKIHQDLRNAERVRWFLIKIQSIVTCSFVINIKNKRLMYFPTNL